MGIDVFKPPVFVICEIDKYTDLYPQISKLRSFIFRGHRCSSWKLSSSFEREFNKYPKSQMIEGAEKYSLQYFKRRVHSHSAVISSPTSDIDLLALMQHHGCPTRLVDFTSSFYVATYFAVRESFQANENFCIWALNFPALKQYTDSILDLENTHKQIHDIIYKLLDLKKNGVIIVEPKSVTKRMSSQQGISLAQTNIHTPFEYNLHSTMNTNCDPVEISLDELHQINRNIINDIRIIKFTFNDKYIQHVRRELLSLNITSESLFPDLEGMARSSVEHMFWQY